jgi:hypothetical protein
MRDLKADDKKAGKDSDTGRFRRRRGKNPVAALNPICRTRGGDFGSRFESGKRRRMFHLHRHAAEFPVEIKLGSVSVSAA